jgi:uncharacterized membrane protein YqjE
MNSQDTVVVLVFVIAAIVCLWYLFKSKGDCK